MYVFLDNQIQNSALIIELGKFSDEIQQHLHRKIAPKVLFEQNIIATVNHKWNTWKIGSTLVACLSNVHAVCFIL